MHYDPAYGIGVPNNTTFGTWTDSVNGILAQQGTSAHYPTFLTNQANGLPGVVFGGNAALCMPLSNVLQSALDAANAGTNAGVTIFITFKTLGSVAHGTIMGASTGLAQGFDLYADGTSVGEYNLFGGVPYAGQTSLSTIALVTFAKGTYSSGANQQLSLFYVNGGSVWTTTTISQGVDGHQICIGGQSLNTYGNVEIFDIVAWGVPLTTAQIMQAEQWTATKYGFSVPWAALSSVDVFFGDSITLGAGTTGGVANTPCWLTASSLSLTLGQWDCLGVGGISTENMTVLAPTWVDPIPAAIAKTVNLIGFEWVNSVQTYPAAFNDAVTYLTARRAISGLKIVWGTSYSYNGDPNTNRESYDSAFDNNTNNVQSLIDSYMPLHTDTGLGLATGAVLGSSWQTYCTNGVGGCTQSTYTPLFADGRHPNNLGVSSYQVPDFLAGIAGL